VTAQEKIDALTGPRPMAVIEKRVRRACYFALAALALICWSLVDPSVIPVIGAMTVGQVVGTASLLWFLFAIVADLRGTYILRKRGAAGGPASLRSPGDDDAKKAA
jgi:hypothetical protein